ncbi:MAG: DNA repair protein RadC [Bacilli bacterium]|nr:DNA repair protein RadC [Bacilli bacterium]
MKIQNMPSNEKPREKIINNGINSLNNIELLAILLRCGNKKKSVIELSMDVLNTLDSIDDISELTIDELTKIEGIGISKASIILASFELAKRIFSKSINKISLPSPKLIYEHFKPLYYNVKQEQLYAIYLDTKGKMISKKLITIGNINSSLIDDKSIFKWAYKYSASAIILVHNHPSGDSTPSKEDLKVTAQIIRQAELLGFIILDHIIIGDNYFSIKMNYKL